MSVSQAADGTAGRTAQSMAPTWEAPGEVMPQDRRAPGFIKGALSYAGVMAFLRRNGRSIAALAALLFMLGLVVLWLIPLRYAATALVVVDPREQRVTNEQDVLPGIGQDAAALQSLIEIAKSDGFLRPLVQKLNVAADSEIAGSETDPSRILEKFRARLDISRRGLTYVIAMTFVSKDPERAAQYANAVAQAFVLSQTQVRTDAADEAAGWLNSRLKTLSDRLRVSEDAVAAFKAQHRIVNAGRESTTRQLRVTELSQQVSAARLRTEEAKNRYEQAQRDLKANVDSPSTARSELLGILRAQRTQLNDQIAQKRAVFGDRHPDLVIALNQLTELNRQIETERRRNIDSAKSDYETVRDQQKSLEQQLKAYEGEMLQDGQDAVKLQELQREAEANKNIYEQFLSRYNTTSEQRLLQATQTKVASLATPPTRPTRPPLPLLLAALAIGSLLSSTAIVTIRETTRSRPLPPQLPEVPDAPKVAVPVVVEARPQPAPVAMPAAASAAAAASLASAPLIAPLDPTPQPEPQPRPQPEALPVWAEIPALAAAADMRSHLQNLFDTLAIGPGARGQVVLVTSAETGTGKSSVARALNALAIERGLLSVLIELSPDAAPAQAETPSQDGVRSLKSTVRSLAMLLDATPNGDAAVADIRTEFGLTVIDAPSLATLPDAAMIAAQCDATLLVTIEGATSAFAIRNAAAALTRASAGRIGRVVNRAARATLDLRRMARQAG
jgi:uncharacterized protein involved in exopolysaccharide biosynthesis/Mrp family chromosome partitioning ATPase